MTIIMSLMMFYLSTDRFLPKQQSHDNHFQRDTIMKNKTLGIGLGRSRQALRMIVWRFWFGLRLHHFYVDTRTPRGHVCERKSRQRYRTPYALTVLVLYFRLMSCVVMWEPDYVSNLRLITPNMRTHIENPHPTDPWCLNEFPRISRAPQP